MCIWIRSKRASLQKKAPSLPRKSGKEGRPKTAQQLEETAPYQPYLVRIEPAKNRGEVRGAFM